MTKIKICGLKREQDIEAANKVLPDYIGFVFAKSRRQIQDKEASILKAKLNPLIKAVGVFVNEDIEKIVDLCRSQTIDIVQLHGDEDEDYIRQLRTLLSNKIIKAVRVRDSKDIRRAESLPVDYLLLDAYDQKQYGGIGKSFDWSLIPFMEKPYFLAGGINAENILKAIEKYNPYALDVSSGVETRGYKDFEKIKEIVELLREKRDPKGKKEDQDGIDL